MPADILLNVIAVAAIAFVSADFLLRAIRRRRAVPSEAIAGEPTVVGLPRLLFTAFVGIAATVISIVQIRATATGVTPSVYSNDALRAKGESVRFAAVADSIRQLVVRRRESDDFMHRGIQLATSGRARSAIALYDSAIGADPRNAEAYNYKGFALFVLGDRQIALDVMKAGVAIDTTNPWAYYNIALAYFANADTAAGLNAIQRTLALDSTFVSTFLTDPQYRRIKNIRPVARLLDRP
jgi:tetratricopeptide (TPR) repeat protein